MILKISASAGSGKTYTLTRRFLELLERADPCMTASGCAMQSPPGRGYSLAEILAATFTNKAAAEMKSRVVSSLKNKALEERARNPEGLLPGASPSLPGKAEEWVELILRHYGSLNIRTIDSLLAMLVRLSALELGLAPDFTPSFESSEYFSPFYDALMEDLLDKSEAGNAPTGFLLFDAAGLRAGLERACRTLLSFTDFAGFTPKLRLHDLTLELVQRLLTGKEVPDMDAAAIHARLNSLHAGMEEAALLLRKTIDDESLQANAHFLSYTARCAESSAYAALPSSVYAAKESLDDCLNKASKGKASPIAHEAFTAFMHASADFSLSLPVFRQALLYAPLVPVAKELHARMREAGQEHPLLPAIRIPLLAGRVLEGEYGVSDALCRLGTRLSRLLLDEFQDTSLEQWAAILPLAVESLSQGGSLTYVGDVKQAIYGWRGGDARLFNAVPDIPQLKAISPRSIERNLEYNWRSHPKIVLHNNAFFSLLARPDIALACLEAMLPKDSPEDWLALAAKETVQYFSQAAQGIPPQKNWEADPKNGQAAVRLYDVRGESGEEVAGLVRARLKELLLGELLEQWEFKDIALLVGSNKEASLLAEWLSDWGLPVVTENSFLLASHPLVCRLVSFLGFLDYPLDDLAFWEFASGQECLGNACAGRCLLPGQDWPARKNLEYGGKRPPLYQLFRKEFPEAWESWIAPFYNEAGLMSAYDTLREVIRRFDLLRKMPEHAPFLQRLLEIAHLAETQGNSSLAAFLAFWKTCSENEKLPLPESMDAIRIMTVHKAKGLEFPVVVLPFHHRSARREPELAVVEHQGMRLLTRAEKGLAYLYYPAAIMNELERLNLLYVAWTRPVYALHAFITRPKKEGALVKALEILLAHYREDASPGLCEWEDVNGDSVTKEACETKSSPAPALTPADDNCAAASTDGLEPSWRPMNWLPRLKIYRSSLEGAKLSPRRRGILAHLCLEHLILSATAGQPSAIRQDVQRAVRQGMRLFPLPVEDPEGVAAEMEDCLFWFACLPEASFWLSKGMREQGIVDGRGNMHRVDLLVDEARPGEDEAQAFMHALDYKTGRYPDPETLLEHHRQVRRYMGLLGDALGRPVRGTLIYLDERRLENVLPEEA